jgi:hypothetical protein
MIIIDKFVESKDDKDIERQNVIKKRIMKRYKSYIVLGQRNWDSSLADKFRITDKEKANSKGYSIKDMLTWGNLWKRYDDFIIIRITTR